jgi:SPP1 family predicted phage head-tail adaptor
MKRTYKAGDLKHPVKLLEPVTVIEGNRRKTTWTEHPAYAAIREVSGKQFFEAQAYHAEDILTFTVRYRADVTAAWRLRHGDNVYTLVGPPNHLGYMGDYMQLRGRIVTGGGT